MDTPIRCALLLTSSTGLDKVEQMFGKKSGHQVDPNKMRSTNEKIVSPSGLCK
jgi:hypothetical protein